MPGYTITEVENILSKLKKNVLKNSASWAEFLKKSAYLYNYSFDDKLLILYDKPNATSVAEYKQWNKLKISIKQGAVATRLITYDKNGSKRLRYVFDITDTRENKRKSWQIDLNSLNKKDLDAYIYDTIKNETNTLTDLNEKEYFFLEESIKLAVYSRIRLNTSYTDAIDYINVLSNNEIRLNTLTSLIDKCNHIILENLRTTASRLHKSSKITIEHEGKYSSFTDEEINIARNTDLVEYLHRNGERIKRVGTNEYTMENHDSMRINGSQFFWNSQGFGGNAIDFCTKYYNMTFQEAMNSLLSFNGYIKSEYNIPVATSTPKVERKLKDVEEHHAKPLPNPLDTKTNRIYAYLTKTRGIDAEIVQQLIKDGKIAQDIKGNLVFKIFDPKLPDDLSGAEITGTLTDKKYRYKQTTERNGNGFVINPTGEKLDSAIFFEAAIDLLSYYSLHKDTKSLLVSMAGLKDKVILKTLEDYNLNPKFCTISSDNDEAGFNFATKVQNEYGLSVHRVNDDSLFQTYSDSDTYVKDWNDLLKVSRMSNKDNAINSVNNEVSNKVSDKMINLVRKSIDELAVGDYVLFDKDIFLISKISLTDNYIVINNVNIPDYILPIIGNNKDNTLKSILESEAEKNNFNYLPIGKSLNKNITFYKIGDFYEAFNDDAVVISNALNLHLTSKTVDGDKLSVVGIPKHSFADYVNNLVQNNIGVYLDTYDNFLNKYKETKSISVSVESDEEKNQDNLEQDNLEQGSEIYFENFENSDFREADLVTITCEFSESNEFENGKIYSVAEFDRIMREANLKHKNGQENALKYYGSMEAWKEAELYGDSKRYIQFFGYDKTYYTINMPNGLKIKERQDIGDNNEIVGIVDWIRQVYDNQEYVVPILKEAIKNEDPDYYSKYFLENKEIVKEYIKDKNYVLAEQPQHESMLRSNPLSVQEEVLPSTPTTTGKNKTYNNNLQNYHITNDNLDTGTNKEKYSNNINAIKTLLNIEKENRQATAEEQDILAKYVGWGGLADVFDSNKTTWANEYAELKELLAPDEYAAARSSTLNAHYTSPILIKAMYNALDNMGFENGRILEPAMGTGNFFGMLPKTMDDSKLYGVELDSLTGRIAKQLYPNAHIEIKGFEKTAFQSNFFDVAIGNVPFGGYKVYDNDFKDGDLIHDYFFKKSLDKVRPGGILAFITSKGTLDKKDSSVRQYLAERAELLGAIRLPNNAFSNANTEVTSDIIFLQKRDRTLSFTEDTVPEWVHLSVDENNIEMNSYFVNNKEMVLGEMAEVSGRFGLETTCKPLEGADLSEQLEKAVQNIKGTITLENIIDTPEEYQDQDINTDIIAEDYRNFCYSVIDGDIYYRENNNMIKQDIKGKRAERLKGMVEISEALRKLISAQRDDFYDADIKSLQNKLNAVYDDFTGKYGILSSKANKNIFHDDDTAALLLALENLDKDGNLESKADIFFKRTVVPYAKPVESVDTASEALAVSIGEKGRVDIDYMAHLCSKPKEEIIKDLEGVIFLNPVTGVFENADEYLSGNVREKLSIARSNAAQDSKFEVNVKSLEAAQPEDLKPTEISAQLGSTWIPVKYYQQFMYELLDTPWWCKDNGNSGDAFDTYNVNTIVIGFDSYTSNYGISNRTADSNNVKANTTYGTSRMNAYKIIEATLNMRPIRIYDYIEDENGNKKAVLNNKETLLAQEKQTLIKNKFKEWVFDDYNRTKDLCSIYNEKFNSIRPREYDGSHITFKGINPEISLRKHQIDAIAHTLYGGNTLLAHTVGAGKSFEIIASAMESKRLGLCSKSMIVVPKAIVNQMGKEFLQLYPTANLLIPTEKDFSKENRERFCSRIATGNYDAIIISHNQLEKIPLSIERQTEFIQNELTEIEDFLLALHSDISASRGFTVKQLESTRKNLEARLQKLNNADKRDTVITFEELGIDKIYIDEAHFFKNKYFYTKMDRVAGINSSSASQRAEDLFMKCRYLDEKTNNKGVVFATGTPISNSIVEMYTMQTYLQYDRLKSLGLNHFDAWASTFGETQVALELAPEGRGYQMKTRFSKFFNLPELMNTFKAVADIKTADMLNLPVPKADYHTVATEASEYQKDLVDGLAERAEAIRSKKVDISKDNMLNITNDGRKLALDQRLANPLLPDDKNSKVNICINNVYNIWQTNKENKSTQIIFSDLSTPHYDGTFNIYDDIKSKLIKKGIPEREIAFIHDCKTDEQKLALFTKVQDGDVRVLLGSTSKLGTGTNCQNKLKAVHHLDCPYRPADLEQRNGRIIRQGNENSEVDIFNYVTKGTFDAYLYQLVENKQKFISQIMTSKSPARSAEDIDECVLNYAEIKALAAGDPKIKEKMDLDIEVNRLRTVFENYQENKRILQENINIKYPEKIQKLNEYISAAKKDAALVEANSSEKFSGMTIDGTYFSDKKEAGTAFIEICRNIQPDEKVKPVGEYMGFKMYVSFDSLKKAFVVDLKANLSYSANIGTDVFGNIMRLDNLLNSIDIKIKEAQNLLTKTEYQLEAAKKEVNEPFAQLDELREKESRLEKLNKELAIDNPNTNIESESVEDTHKYKKTNARYL